MPIHHIVLLKFKPDITPADVDKVRSSIHALPSQIPAISSLKKGHKIKHPLDHEFDEGVIFIFKDEAALKEYMLHKAHRDFQEHTASYVHERLIFDIHSESD